MEGEDTARVARMKQIAIALHGELTDVGGKRL
jgi:hypothetical protein